LERLVTETIAEGYCPLERSSKWQPIDLSVLGDLCPARNTEWRKRIPAGGMAPKLILEFWEPYWVVKEMGPMAKGAIIKWTQKGYQSTCRSLNSLQVGGVVDRTWLVVARVQDQEWAHWTWPIFPAAVSRPMNNCLRPVGIPRSAYQTSPNVGSDVVVPDSQCHLPQAVSSNASGNPTPPT
jgi:hypothetical protein